MTLTNVPGQIESGNDAKYRDEASKVSRRIENTGSVGGMQEEIDATQIHLRTRLQRANDWTTFNPSCDAQKPPVADHLATPHRPPVAAAGG